MSFLGGEFYMQKRKLGKQGLEVSAVGLGCMGMSFAYGSADDSESIRVLHRSLEVGINFWDTAEIYGPYKNEELLGRALKGKPRQQVIIATKFAFKIGPAGERIGLDSSPAHIKEAIEGSLKRLDTDYIDLYYQHRLDPNTPIEDTIGALAELIKAGKIRYIGLSEVGPGTIRRANKIYPLTAIQSEYSLWERGVEEKVLPTLRELGIGLVAYSPIGRGFLSGRFKSVNDLEESDWRRNNPRFKEENFKHNLELVNIVQEIAAANSATAAQVALAWLLKQGKDIVPIPGTKHVKYLEENAQAEQLTLPDSTRATLNKALASFHTAGSRYPEDMMKFIDRTE
jgi:aryl-alcohol dehydrogenase-like predicted oxidoreductase